MLTNSNGEVFEGQFEDLTGQKFNMLTVLEPDRIHQTPKGDRQLYWLVQCDCGNTAVKKAKSIKSGYSKSCGCLRIPAVVKARKTHGEADSRLNNTWYNMKKRCYYKDNPKYKNYGGRGIKICDEWKEDYSVFSKWAHENGYSEEMTIERINVNGDYEPSNCKWIPMIDQANNKTSNKWVYIDGKKLSPQDIEEQYNIPVKTVYARIARGDEGEAVARPLGRRQFRKR